MKRLTCEMCGSTDLIKQDGVFVCQSCGCKYSIEEARKMMVEGPVDVSGSVVKVDQSEKLKNLLSLARRARIEKNSEDAKKYYELALIENPNSWESAFYSMYYKTMESSFVEMSSALPKFNNRLVSTVVLLLSEDSPESPDRVKEILKDLVASTTHLYTLIMGQVMKYHAKEGNDFAMEFMSRTLSKRSTDGLSKQHLDRQHNAFDLAYSMVNQLLFVYKQIQESDKPVEDEETLGLIRAFSEEVYSYYADDKQMANIRDMSAFARNVVEMEAMFRKTDPDYVSKSLAAFSRSLNERIRKLESQGFKNDARKYYVARDAITAARQAIAERERQARVAAYWDAHPDEKQRLETERDGLTARIESLNAAVKELDTGNLPRIRAAENELKQKTAAESGVEEQRTLLRELETQRNNCGIFKGKEKKALTERIDNIEKPKLEQLQKQAEEERNALKLRVRTQIAEIRNESRAQREEAEELQKRLEEITAELEKDR